MTSRRASQLVFATLVAYLVCHAVASAYVMGALWDWRVFYGSWYDHAWQLELAYSARLGEWSGRDLHYPRGPLWQAVAWLASRPWAPFDGARTLAGIHLGFHLLAIGAVVTIVLRRVEGGWRRCLVLLVVGSVSYAVGVPTFRALLSAALVLVYIAPDEQRPSWRRAASCAALLAAAMLVSFDRFGLGGLSLSAMVVAELALTRMGGGRIRAPLQRALFTSASLLAVLLLLSLLAWVLGADPFVYAVEQRRLASAYATGMRTTWHVGVPPANVLAFFLLAASLIVVGARAGWSRVSLVWVAGALPPALFGVVTSDQGHVFMALLPLIIVLTLVAARSANTPWLRLSEGVLGATALLGWLGTYPESFSPHPRAFVDAHAALVGDKRPDRAFRSDHGRAVAWARAVREREEPRCMSIAPSLGVVHAMAEIPGPTQLRLRWNEMQQAELAQAIREADCPIHLHRFISFDDIGGSWFLGPDFLTVAERYRFDERVDMGVVAMRRRDAPSPPTVRALARRDAELHTVSLPGELEVPLEGAITGEEVLRLGYTLEVPAWRAQLGGAPWVEWRFEANGAPLGDWEPLHHVHVGDGEVLLAPDPEAVEHRWILERSVRAPRSADRLRLRFKPRGRLSASRTRFAVRSLEVLEPPPVTRATESLACREHVDLLDEMRRGRSFARMTSPRPSERHFNLEPNPHPVPLAEVFFRVRPCSEACFRARLGVAADPSVSDGVEFEIHAIRGRDRALLYQAHVPAGSAEVAVEVPLEQWPELPQFLRIGTRTGEGEASDYAFVAQPTVESCSARAWLSDALARGDVRVEDGGARVEGRDVLLAPGETRVSYPLYVVDPTCFGTGASADAVARARVTVLVEVDGLEQVLHRYDGPLGPEPIPLIDGLHDWVEREATLIIESRADQPVRLWGPHIYRCSE